MFYCSESSTCQAPTPFGSPTRTASAWIKPTVYAQVQIPDQSDAINPFQRIQFPTQTSATVEIERTLVYRQYAPSEDSSSVVSSYYNYLMTAEEFFSEFEIADEDYEEME
ncbi:unnamed protein product [Blepharisma stoltei]|uniref:Uncharacterized protein n=1 Tax=Blepharisma stoltei TaxID=1481888 RepID=A0AAU9JS98_9CILI|nr:unnamed protein product [Blepharisma stoltei]